MNDRELLELAAKAAGYDDAWWSEPFGYVLLRSEGNRAWDPLANDGDALRLAVKLEINVLPNMEATSARNPSYTKWCNEDARTDPYAATRLAIVRAAAEIGRNTK